MTEYQPGDVLEYRHKGQRYVGRLVKAQRRHALIQGRGHGDNPLSVPWNAVVGIAERKPKEQPQP